MAPHVAIVFDDTIRPETTGQYCRRALAQLTELCHVRPAELAQLSKGQFDAIIYIDDGLDYDTPSGLAPSVWWAIDTHLTFERCLQRALRCDFVFAAQRDGARRFEHLGIAASWLPLACDPEVHRGEPRAKCLDWCFVGNFVSPERAELISQLRTRFPNSFVGNRYFEEMVRTYAESRIVFNRSIRNDVNMRVFEALASGSLLLTNDLADNGQSELFDDGIHFVTYKSERELLERMDWLLAHEMERESIAARGVAEVLAKHTYRHRMEVILDTIRAVKPAGRQAVSRDLPIKDSSYFEWDRPDVLAMVPPTARRIADLGCGSGRLGARIKARQQAEVWGIERDPNAANRASQRLDHVLSADLDSGNWSLPDTKMDAVICADILEHLRSPEKLLRRCQQFIATDGCLIASIPNVQHHSIVSSLLDGNFTYEPAGLLDEDHVRLFTRREIEKLFYRCGYRIAEWRMVPGEGYAEWKQAGHPGTVRIGGLEITGLNSQSVEAFFAYQYLVRAEPVTRPPVGLTSIIIGTHNQLSYTRRCLESLRFRTDEVLEIIAVDNGSTDGTVEYFQSQPDVVLISNPENRGFPAAVNQGLKIAKGQQVVLLNNDTILTTGWLRRLLNALDVDPKIGLVGPVTNHVSGPQQIEVGYRDLASLDGFAWDHGQAHTGQLMDLDRLVGFCLLIRREVLDSIGGLDESFGIGNFEDDDYCLRARNAGFRTVVALDSFIHHFGSVTFRGAGLDFARILQENEQRFRTKWESHGTTAAPKPPGKPLRFREAEGGGLLLVRSQPQRLSLCMIVRNNETTIRQCLESIRPWVDEMIVVDTGSTDETPLICEQLGATVHRWTWCDDFSAARNESVKHATGDWIFWMDSDDTIPEECGRRLQELANGQHSPNTLGYVIQVHCPGPDNDARNVTAVDHVKLFRNRPDLRFEHRIHEQILPAIRRAGGDVAFTDIYVVHSGADHTPEGRQRKLERDFKLLELDLAERPDHPFVLFNLGMTHADVQQHDAAVHWLSRCLQVSQPEESHVRKTYALLISSLMQLRRREQASVVSEQARSLFPDDKEIQFRRAMLSHELGQLEEAVRLYEQVLTPSVGRHFKSVDMGLAGFKARHNLALVYEDLGEFGRAETEWRAILSDHDDYIPAQIGLIECLIRRGALYEAEPAVQLLRTRPASKADGIRMAARLAEARDDLPAAIDELQRGVDEFPDDPGLLRELARLLHATEDFPSALSVLGRLTQCRPDDAAAWHNRGVILGLLNRTSESEEAFARADVLRRQSSDMR